MPQISGRVVSLWSFIYIYRIVKAHHQHSRPQHGAPLQTLFIRHIADDGAESYFLFMWEIIHVIKVHL